MTKGELEQLILEWMAAKGGTVTDEDFDTVVSVLGEHFPNPEEATLEAARQVLGL